MGKYQKKCHDGNEGEEKEKINVKARKVPLKTILRKDVDRNTIDTLNDILFERSHTFSLISTLASLLVCYKINNAMDNEDWAFFDDAGVVKDGKLVYNKGKTMIRECFVAVSICTPRPNVKMLGQVGIQMPPEFKRWVTDNCGADFEWPDRTGLTNAFNAWVDTYTTNLTTNLKLHFEKRLRWYLKVLIYRFNMEKTFGQECIFDGLDERNAIKYACKAQDWTNGDALRQTKMMILVDYIKSIGWPGTMTMTQYVKIHWLESIRLFAKIQRLIEDFKANEIAQWNAFSKCPKHETTVPKPPSQVRNFSVMPLCDYHLKHFVLDYWDLFQLMSVNDWLPKTPSKKTGKMIKPDKNHYKQDKSVLWAMLFDMDKINEIIGPKNKFHYQIVTDSVSASVMFTPREPKKTVEKPLDASVYNDKLQEIAIDPGMKTYLAGVVIDHETGVEVSEELLLLIGQSFLKFAS